MGSPEPGRTWQPQIYAPQKLELLLELGAFQDAFAMLEALIEQGEAVPTLIHARVLESAGKGDAARKLYNELSA